MDLHGDAEMLLQRGPLGVDRRRVDPRGGILPAACRPKVAYAGSVPLLVLDMYEHSYQMDFGAGVARYIDAFFSNVNWDAVNDRFEPSQLSTVASTQIYFWVSGAYGLAAIIFIASFLVPLFKLTSLILLAVLAQRHSDWRQPERARLYQAAVPYFGSREEIAAEDARSQQAIDARYEARLEQEEARRDRFAFVTKSRAPAWRNALSASASPSSGAPTSMLFRMVS